MRWPNEDAYDEAFAAASAQCGVPIGLLKGITGHESGFDPAAVRAEPAIGDQSTGLMQLLFRTAQGVGYRGDVDGLLDPTTNIMLGAEELAQLQDQTGDWASTISAYNGGIRPQYAFGTRATIPGRVCVARAADGSCATWYSYGVGEFGNQPYVDAVLDAAAYFGWSPDDSADDAAGGGPTTKWLEGIAVLGGVLTIAIAVHRHRRRVEARG